jgi:ubiquitin carboxyl-terminal hydrolase L5
MKGLAIFNSPLIREAHNSLARPSDLRTALHAAIKTTLEAQNKSGRPSHQKSTSKQKQQEPEEAFHFIGYVPAFGKVWELDGLKSGPLEVGELPAHETDSSTNTASTDGWMAVARPALRMKMQKYGGESIQFSLLALVDDQYQLANDKLEMLRREKEALERRLNADFGQDEWRVQVSLPLVPVRISFLRQRIRCLRRFLKPPTTLSQRPYITILLSMDVYSLATSVYNP